MSRIPDAQTLNNILRLLIAGAKPVQIARKMDVSLKAVTQRVSRNPRLVSSYMQYAHPELSREVYKLIDKKYDVDSIATTLNLPRLIIKAMADHYEVT